VDLGAGAGAVVPGLPVLVLLLVPQGLTGTFVGLLVAGPAKLADGDGMTTTGGGSGMAAAELDGAVSSPGGSMFDWTTKKATPPIAKTNSTMTNPSVVRLREPSSSGGAEILSLLLAMPGAVVGETAGCEAAGTGDVRPGLSMPG
jgi:hypothetical protein